jgi:hypothetical protein
MGNEPSITLIEASGAQPPIRCELVRDSHPSPRFSDVALKVMSLRASADGTKLLASVAISGTVHSTACDLVPGEQGEIRKITFKVNWADHGITIPTLVTKAREWQSLERPYPMSATFAAEFRDLEISTATNSFEFLATDSVPGIELTGFASFAVRIDLESGDAARTGSESPEGHERHAIGELVFVVWTPRPENRSSGGEMHAYYARVEAPAGPAASSRTQGVVPVVAGPDNHHYLAGPDGQPQPFVLMAGAQAAVGRPTLASGPGTLESGFLEGFMFRRAGFARGSLEVEQSQAGEVEVLVSSEVAEALGVRERRVARLGCRVAEFSEAAQAVHDFLRVLNRDDHETLSKIAARNWERLYSCSRELELLGQYALEVVRGIQEGAHGESRELGEEQGRICCETLRCIMAERKLGGPMSKEKVLRRLREAVRAASREESLVERVLQAWRRLPF